MAQPRITFWYEFASTYSYVAAMRIEAVAKRADVKVVWRPFLLGPIFAALGWTTSPFNLQPAKGRYMWRDMERLTEALDLKLVRPESFPANGLLAARIATALPDDGRRATFSKAVYTAEFADGADISDRGVLTAVLGSLGEDAEAIFALASLDATKGALRAATAEAEKSGVFGAPSLVTPDGELFWGNDRIEEALAWVNRHR